MATHAIHRSARELPTHVALSASHSYVSTCERERRLVVIKLCAGPLRRRVTSNAPRRESSRQMIRVRGLLEIGQMATHAIHRSAGEAVICVTLGTRRGHVGAGEREFGGRVVIELGAHPLCGCMASNASCGKAGRRMIRVRRLLKIIQMAAGTITGHH